MLQPVLVRRPATTATSSSPASGAGAPPGGSASRPIPAMVRDDRRRRRARAGAGRERPPRGANPLEEAAAYQQLIEDFALTHDEVATRVGKSRATVTNTLRLLQLPPVDPAARCNDGTLSHGSRPGAARHARTARSRSSSPSGSSPRTSRCGRSRRRSASTRPSTTAAAPDDAAAAPTVAGRPQLRPPGLLELEELLGDYLETRVQDLDGRAARARSWSSSRPSRTSSGSTGA